MHKLLVLLPVVLLACSEPQPAAVDVANVPPPPSIAAAQQADAHITLSAAQVRDLAIETAVVAATEQPVALSLPGEVVPSPEHYALVSAPISGRVARIQAHEGEAVRAGQTLLYLESLEFANLVAAYMQAEAEATFQRTQVERLDALVARKISPRSKLDKAQADLQRADVDVRAARARLRAVGLSDAQIATWASDPPDRPLLPLVAPISGRIDEHQIELGQAVEAYDELLSLIDPSEVLVRGFVPPEDAALIAVGNSVEVGRGSDGVQHVGGTILTINPALDATSKAVLINVRVRTDGSWPRPGESVHLDLFTDQSRPVLTIPLAALQYDGEQATVFVQRDDATYEPRAITIDRLNDDRVLVASGLVPGERVAVSQVFSLKALSRYALYGEE